MMSMSSSRSQGPPRKWVRPQPFYTAILLVTLLVTFSYLRTLVWDSPASQQLEPLLGARSTPNHCRDVHQHPDDSCAFVRANCEDEQPGLAPYLEIYYCNPSRARPFVFILLAFWLGLLFMTIGIAASDFFTPNLQTIAAVLSMPENLTGVTFLALGNGSPDLFSTIMSMRSNSAAMAVGELIGAASFITAIVAGSIAMVKEFRVDKQTFVRDLLFFAVAVLFTLWFLLDGHLYYRECIFMIVYYIFYVAVVSGLHWWSSSRANKHAQTRQRAREIETLLRNLGQERYQDEQPAAGPESNEAPIPASTAHSIPIPAEGMPRIEIESAGAEEEQRIAGNLDDEEEEEEMEHRRHIGAEIANSMRVRRPTASRRNTGTFIRPSLVGALEFNAAFGRFKKEVRAEPSLQRPDHMRRHSMQNMPQTGYGYPTTGPTGPTIAAGESSQNRDRSYSHAGNVTAAYGDTSFPELIEPISEDPSGLGSGRAPSSLQRAPSPTRSFQLDGNLAVPPSGHDSPRPDLLGSGAGSQSNQSLGPNVLRLDVSSRRSTGDQSDTLSPFPVYTDSPMPMSPRSETGRMDSGLQVLPRQSASRQVTADSQVEQRRRPRWWWRLPRGFPSPENIVTTLFPTIQNWREKGPLDAFVSAISVPSFFLLSVTLPVVDAKNPESDNGSACSVSEAASDDDPAFERFDNEWDMFRRHRHGMSPASSIRGPTSRPLSLMGVDDAAVVIDGPGAVPKVIRGRDGSILCGEQPHQPLVAPLAAVDSEEDLMGWNKWQVLLQVLAGPPFAAFITSSILLEQDGDVVVRAMWWSTLASGLLFLAVLVSTSADRRPKYHSLLCFPGFLVSVSWIAAIAGEVVGVLKAIGVIWGISEAILGLTVFAAGNSVGDWVSNYTIAKLGSPVMAFSGCIGGPMLNILLGISTGGLVGMRAKARHRREKHPDLPVDLKPFKIQISGSLVVTAATLLITLLALLVFISANKWVFSRRLGMGLALLWCVSTGVNLVIEGTGVWSDVV